MRRIALASLALAALLPVSPARAAQTVNMVGTQFVPVSTSLAKSEGVTFVNAEPLDYPEVGAQHNLIADTDVAGTGAVKPFPLSTGLIKIGQSYSCTGTASGLSCPKYGGGTKLLTPGTYAYKCGTHADQMRGLLTVA